MITHLQEGEMAPLFEGKNQHGETVALKNFRGKKVILYFYPRDNTPTCTKQACNLQDNYVKLQTEGFEVIGISPDTVQSHAKFAHKYDLSFTLVADSEKEIALLYGVFGEKKFMGKQIVGIHRTTFVIDKKGFINRIIRKVKSKEHSEQILLNY